MLQVWDSGDGLPAIDEIRVMAYMALLSGAETLSFFKYDPAAWSRPEGFVRDFTNLMVELTGLARDFADAEIYPILGADELFQAEIHHRGQWTCITVNTLDLPNGPFGPCRSSAMKAAVPGHGSCPSTGEAFVQSLARRVGLGATRAGRGQPRSGPGGVESGEIGPATVLRPGVLRSGPANSGSRKSWWVTRLRPCRFDLVEGPVGRVEEFRGRRGGRSDGERQPRLAVTGRSGQGYCSMVAQRSSARPPRTRRTSVAGSRMTNSSPPYRATRVAARALDQGIGRRATRWSPAGWPKVSLYDLKRYTSTSPVTGATSRLDREGEGDFR